MFIYLKIPALLLNKFNFDNPTITLQQIFWVYFADVYLFLRCFKISFTLRKKFLVDETQDIFCGVFGYLVISN